MRSDGRISTGNGSRLDDAVIRAGDHGRVLLRSLACPAGKHMQRRRDMMTRTLYPRSTRTVVLVLLATVLASCFKWSREPTAPATAAREHEGSAMRLTLADGRQVVLRGTRLDGDSIRGRYETGRLLRAVAVADVTAVELHRFDAARSLVAVGAGVAILAVIASLENELRPPPPETTFSCPLVYAWDGRAWVLESGTFGGAIAPALARAETDALEHAVVEDGYVRLRVANELPETDHVDAVNILAVDHDPDVSVVPGPAGLHTAGRLHGPASAADAEGRDVLALVERRDGRGWESALRFRDADDVRDGVVLSFPRESGARTARLVVDGRTTPWASYLMARYLEAHGDGLDAWYASLGADGIRAAAMRGILARDAFLRVSVLTGSGWQVRAHAWDAPPELVRRQAMILDLRDVEGDTIQVRLDAPPSFWSIDHVAIAYGDDRPVNVRRIEPEPAAGGDGKGATTLLARRDGRHLVMERGDAVELAFPVPAVTRGLSRTYLVEASGWYRIHVDAAGPPRRDILTRVEQEPGGIARLSNALMNAGLLRRAAGLSGGADGEVRP
jgi:hypothetical protein